MNERAEQLKNILDKGRDEPGCLDRLHDYAEEVLPFSITCGECHDEDDNACDDCANDALVQLEYDMQSEIIKFAEGLVNGWLSTNEEAQQKDQASPDERRMMEEKLPIGQRVLVKELGIEGWVYESGMPDSGLDRVYGIQLDEVAFPKSFVATKVWHCLIKDLDPIGRMED